MSGRRKMVLAFVGLLMALAISIPLVQKLSIDLVQLQYRDRILSENAELGEVSDSLGVPVADFADALGAAHIEPARLRNMTLIEIGRATGQSVEEVKQIIAEIGIGQQVGDAYGWTFWIQDNEDLRH